MERVPIQDNLTIKDIQNRYGPVYDFFSFRSPLENQEEIDARDIFIKEHIKENPLKIFETGNDKTINDFDVYFNMNKDRYKRLFENIKS